MNIKDLVDKGIVQDIDLSIEYVNENGEKVKELFFKPNKTVPYIELRYTKVEIDKTTI